MDGTMPETSWSWRGITAALILVSGGLHLWYLCHCSLDLAPDEAHYWHWSQNLDASYYSKGPLVAYLIRASCEVAGDWSRQVCGTELAAVRLPALICGSLLLVALYILTLQSFGSEPLATMVVAGALTVPAISLSRTLMTIDAPYACCWGWALVIGHRAIFKGSSWAWPVLGLVVGAGILAKYTMILWLASAGLFLICVPEYRRILTQPGFWIMVSIAAICCLPILWWNVHTGWVGLRHVEGQAGVAHEATAVVRWTGPLQYVGGQFALLFGIWFAIWAVAMIRSLPLKDLDPERRFLWFMSVPQFLLFAVFSLRTEVQINWPVTCYLSGMVLAAPWLVGKCKEATRRRRGWYVGSMATSAILGVAAVVFILDIEPFRPLLARLAGPPTELNALPIRRYDPTCRLRGWHFLGKRVDEICSDLQRDGDEPIIAASRWTMASELAFYCKGHPSVYSVGTALWDRQSQLDIWRPNPVYDADEFLGKTFVFVDVGRVPPQIESAFDHIEKTQSIVYSENDVPLVIWDVTICHGFHGFASLPKPHY
jgi:4-amino-4-deoxy-L-arabinose transferase-like glycosyltransferase